MEHTNEPLSEEEILSLFPASLGSSDSSLQLSEHSESNHLFCPQLLVLYYLLLYEDLYQTHKIVIGIVWIMFILGLEILFKKDQRIVYWSRNLKSLYMIGLSFFQKDII